MYQQEESILQPRNQFSFDFYKATSHLLTEGLLPMQNC